jgi:hypothetical protein
MMEIKKGRWSESEVEKLNTMQEHGFDIDTMSLLLDRPKTSVYGKIWHMRKQNEITSFNVEDLPPKYDPDAKKVTMKDLIDYHHESTDEDAGEVFFDLDKEDVIELMLDKVQEDVAYELFIMKRYVIASTLASLSALGLVAWTILS